MPDELKSYNVTSASQYRAKRLAEAFARAAEVIGYLAHEGSQYTVAEVAYIFEEINDTVADFRNFSNGSAAAHLSVKGEVAS